MAFNISYIYHAIDKFTPIAARINKSVERTRQKIRNLGNQMDTTGRKISKLGGAFGSVTSRIVAMGAALAAAVGVKALISFDKEMSNVKAKSGATAAEFKTLRDEAKRLGATTIFSASEIAGGMTFLAKAGFNTNKILGSIVDVQNLASSSGIEMATAGNIVSNVMSGMDMEAKDLITVVDVLAAATAGSNIDIMSVGQGMKFVGGASREMNQSLKQTVAALGVLGDAAMEGGMAGRNLKMILLKLAVLPPKISKGLQGMGVDLKKINPLTSDLSTIFDEFAKAGLSVAQMQQMVGVEAFTAFSILIKESKKFSDIIKNLDKSAGAAKRMADIMKDNLAGGITEAISAFEGLIITIGDAGLTSALRGLAASLTVITRALQWLITTFPRFTALISLSIAALIGIKVALMGSALAMKIYVAALAIGRTAMLLFNAAMFANPLGMLIGLMFVATAAFYGFRDAIGEAVESLIGLFGASMPAWLRSLFGMAEKIITVKHVLDGKESPIGAKNGKEGGVAVNTPGSTSTLNGTININAPPGVVNSVSSSVKGAGGNLGISMAGAG